MSLPYIKPRADPDFRQDDQLWASAKLKIKEITVASKKLRGPVNQHSEYVTEEIGQAHWPAPTAPHAEGFNYRIGLEKRNKFALWRGK